MAKYEHYRGGYFATNAQALQAAYRLALLCCDAGRWDDAESWTEYGRDVPVPDHFHDAAVLGLAARARIAAHRGDFASAVEIGRRAVDLASRSDASTSKLAPGSRSPKCTASVARRPRPTRGCGSAPPLRGKGKRDGRRAGADGDRAICTGRTRRVEECRTEAAHRSRSRRLPRTRWGDTGR